MSDLAHLLAQEANTFSARVHAVSPTQWGDPTPCSDWDVRALLNHVTAEHLWAPHLLDGQTLAEVGGRYDGDVLGSDPVAAWDSAAAASLQAFSAPAALERTVHLSFGDAPGTEYATQMLTDLAVHGWDLATATGQAATIAAQVAELLWSVWSPRRDLISGSGVFGKEVVVDPGSPPADRLLGLLGRVPATG